MSLSKTLTNPPSYFAVNGNSFKELVMKGSLAISTNPEDCNPSFILVILFNKRHMISQCLSIKVFRNGEPFIQINDFELDRIDDHIYGINQDIHDHITHNNTITPQQKTKEEN